MRILFIGDIVGKGGRRAVSALAPVLREEFDCQFIIGNGENMAGGGGITGKCIRSVSPPLDVITGGDHIWDQKELVNEITDFPHVLRPANVYPGQPGRGFGLFKTASGLEVGVISLQGRTFLNNQADCPFAAADRIIAELKKLTRVIFVDFHGEATSEKIAMGRYLDGRVTAVLGTHTHVATADEQIFPGGTAYLTDVGMVGGIESILGRAVKPVVSRFVTGMPSRFDIVTSDILLQAVLVECDPETGKALQIQRVARKEG